MLTLTLIPDAIVQERDYPRYDMSKARAHFAEIIDSVGRDGEIVIVTRRGKDLAAIIPMSMLSRLS